MNGQTKLGAGQIQFHQWCEPPLEGGDYTLDVAQDVTELDKHGSYSQAFSFSVAGPRFALNPAEVYSVYPPKGYIGDFANTLPHVVFTRRTLPWERSLIPGPRKANDKLPWMALLVLSARDFARPDAPEGGFPEVKSRPVGELIHPEPNVSGPQLKLAAYEKEKDLCNTVDLPWQLFRAIVPTEADLAYLAHVREVNTGNKETLSFLADGWFSVVLANRFPEPEVAGAQPPQPVENRAHLVSLEGMQKYLPGSGESVTNNFVRLAVLSSWSFRCRETITFKDSIDKLKVRRLCVPWHGRNETLSGAETQVSSALAMGYTALNHNTRLGEKSVSWYRGPLVPLYLAKETNYRFLPAADSAVRYNPLDGMMDVTYAAAFQLGRLLGLQDRYFATALYAYRKRVTSQINYVLGRKRVQSALGSEESGGESDLMRAYVAKLDPGSKPSTEKKWSAATEYEVADNAPSSNGNSVQPVSDSGNTLRLTTDFNLVIPGNICQWLARLLLLYRVPFTNLVADERMLPPDSMGFFYLDPGWLTCLLQGACSVGRSSSRDELVDQQLRDNFLKLAIDESAKVRTGTPAGQDPDGQIPVHPITQVDWPQLTGFLMHSPLVQGWQGLEMQAWSDSGDHASSPLKPYRIDRLAPDIMLCIFNGKVQRIEIKQPPEGMHFGATPVTGGGYTRIHLRRLNKSGAFLPADQLDDSRTDIPLRPDVQRVINVAKLAGNLKDTLERKEARDSKAEFTSADFGVEMVESPGRAVFDVGNKP